MNLIGNLTIVRAIEETDLPFLKRLINNPAIEYMTLGANFPVSDYQQRKWFENCDFRNQFICVVESITTHELIGYISVKDIDYKNGCAKVGIKIDISLTERQKGDLEEAANMGIRYFFDEFHLHRLEAYALKENLLSIKLMMKLGFKKEGELRKKVFRHGEWKDVVLLALLSNDC